MQIQNRAVFAFETVVYAKSVNARGLHTGNYGNHNFLYEFIMRKLLIYKYAIQNIYIKVKYEKVTHSIYFLGGNLSLMLCPTFFEDEQQQNTY